MRNTITTLLGTLALCAGISFTAAAADTKATATPAAAPATAKKPAASAHPALLFAGIPWGSNAATVKNKMKAAGYTFDKIDNNDDLLFSGKAFGQDTKVGVSLPDGKLSTIGVRVLTSFDDAMTTFAEMRKVMIANHGKPSLDLEQIPATYRERKGGAEDAIRAGKGTVAVAWNIDDKPANGYPTAFIRIMDDLQVLASYHGPTESDAVLERKAKTKDARNF